MSEAADRPPGGLAPRLERQVGRVLDRVTMIAAIIGGLILVALVAMSVISITGRALVGLLPFRWLGPVPGDFELVEAGTAVAVIAFLHWCQMRRGHVTVDVFISGTSPRIQALLGLTGNLLLFVAAALIAWRLQLGLADKLRYPHTTMILQMPVWYGYAGAAAGAWLFALTSLYTVWRALNEVFEGAERAT